MDEIGYIGPINLGDTPRLFLQCRDGSDAPIAPDAAPSWAIYGTTESSVLTGSLGSSDADSKTGWRSGTAEMTAGNGFAADTLYHIRFAYAHSSGTAKSARGSFRIV